jgi:hypothetical protein
VCAEASTVLRAVPADFFFNCWCLEVPSDNRIRRVPWCVHYHAHGKLSTRVWKKLLKVNTLLAVEGQKQLQLLPGRNKME